MRKSLINLLKNSKGRLGRLSEVKVYVASRFNNQQKVKEIYRELIENGFEITVDWTKHKKVKPYEKNPKMSEKYSKEDIEGVKDSDILILLTTENPGKGMFVEMGAAIIVNILTGKPKIYIIGDYNKQSLFYFHPNVKRLNTIEDVIEDLKKSEVS